jgi:hypothetical protein
MDIEIADRRLQRRFSGASLSICGTMRPGCPVRVVDVSKGGVRVESDRPLRPGTRVHVRLTTGEWTRQVWAVVLRCTVAAVDPEMGVVYRGALRFEEPCAPIPGD